MDERRSRVLRRITDHAGRAFFRLLFFGHLFLSPGQHARQSFGNARVPLSDIRTGQTSERQE
jgi:hypothetical protein